jgi:hypothetical protein
MKVNQDFMAQLIKTINWKFGADVVVKKFRGKTIITSYPDMSKRKLSPKQIEVNELMQEASQYAKNVISYEKYKAEAQVRLNVPGNRLYHALVKEYFEVQRGQKPDPYEGRYGSI